jgi:hypothetical protein
MYISFKQDAGGVNTVGSGRGGWEDAACWFVLVVSCGLEVCIVKFVLV